MSFAEKLYNLLLKAYPAPLRKEHGAEMLQLFGDQLRESRARGHVPGLWLRTLADWLRTVLSEHLSQLNRRASEPRPAAPMQRLMRRGLLVSPNLSAAILIVVGIVVYRRIQKLWFFHPGPQP